MKNLAYSLIIALIVLLPLLAVLPSDTECAGNDEAAPAFPHETHLEAELECTDCHTGVRASAEASDNNLPVRERCLDCHGEGGSEIASVTWEAIPEIQSLDAQIRDGLIFSHQAHLERDLDCEYCHVGEDPAQSAVKAADMDVCFRCHEGRRGLDDCAVCHQGVAILRPSNHDMMWVNHHREDARLGEGNCGACHNEEYCQECHEGGRTLPTEESPVQRHTPEGPQVAANRTLTQRAHELNYRFTHALDVAGKESECQTCHSSETFCSDCHNSESDPTQMRPAWHGGTDWGAVTGAVGSGGGRHGEMARRDIELCAGCHEVTLAGTDPTCLTCHRDFTPGLGDDLSTHDSDFASGLGKGPWHDDDGAICYVCHTRSHEAGDAGFCGYCHESED